MSKIYLPTFFYNLDHIQENEKHNYKMKNKFSKHSVYSTLEEFEKKPWKNLNILNHILCHKYRCLSLQNSLLTSIVEVFIENYSKFNPHPRRPSLQQKRYQ